MVLAGVPKFQTHALDDGPPLLVTNWLLNLEPPSSPAPPGTSQDGGLRDFGEASTRTPGELRGDTADRVEVPGARVGRQGVREGVQIGSQCTTTRGPLRRGQTFVPPALVPPPDLPHLVSVETRLHDAPPAPRSVGREDRWGPRAPEVAREQGDQAGADQELPTHGIPQRPRGPVAVPNEDVGGT